MFTFDYLPGRSSSHLAQDSKACGTEADQPCRRSLFGGFWRRVCARVVDLVQLSLLSSGISLIWVVSPLRTVVPASALLPVQLAVAVIYEVACVSAFGGTVGKLLLGLRIVGEDHAFIGRTRAFFRSIAAVVSGLILCAGFVMVAFDPQKRALHDRLCKTRVVTRWLAK